jgi:WD40 repeat protein
MGCDECFDGKPVESLAWDSVSKKLAAAGANGLIRVWKVQDEGK